MHKHFLAVCGLVILSLAALGLTAQAGNGYLKTGPVPLRYQAVHNQDLSLLPPLPKPRSESFTGDSSSHTNQDAQNPMGPMWTPPYAQPIPNANTAYLNSLLPTQMYGATNSTLPPPTANELLPPSPQMLVEYFRPFNGSTNSSGISVAVPVNFAPATPPPVPSSATYRVE